MSTVGKLAVIALLIEICVQSGRPQQCSIDSLPEFGDTVSRSPERDRFQAIVPAYRFQCSGRVAEWGACVQPGGDNVEYYIQFQVWRPTGTEGCYELVGYNEPPVDDTQERSEEGGSRSITPPGPEYGILSPVDHCVVLTVRENEQIDFQPGDVVGYYVDNFRYVNSGGIQWIKDSEIVVHYKDDISREDIKSQYALNGPNPTECGFPVANSSIYTLSDSSTNAPIISLSLVSLPLASSSRPVVASSTPTAPSVAPSATNLSTSSSCGTGVPLDTENACGDTQDDAADNTKRNVSIISAILIIIMATVTIIAVLLWLRKRKRDVTDHSADILESNSAYSTVNVMDTSDYLAATSVPTSANIAYQTPSIDKKSVDIGTSASEAYVNTDIPTFANASYQPIKQPIQSNIDSVYEYVCHN